MSRDRKPAEPARGKPEPARGETPPARGKPEPAREKTPHAQALPFSRPFSVDELLRRPDEPIKVSAEPDEREALARADDIPAIGALEGEFKVARQGRFVRVTGQVRARVTQECVVTLEPFETEVVEAVDVRFADAPAAPGSDARSGGPSERMSRRRASQAQQARKAEPAPVFPTHEEEDPPDPIIGGRIDLGALAAEFMALGLDPWPRKPGVEFTPVEEEGEAAESPFARLARLKKDH